MLAGLKTIISALLKAVRMLAEVILLTLFCMMVFALFAIQVYAGVLRHKCVRDLPPSPTPASHEDWADHVKNPSNYAFIVLMYEVVLSHDLIISKENY